MLHFVQSNHLEKLFDRLCQVLDEQEDTPLKPLEIVVQNAGMARWVSQQMAIRKGIAANLTFPLPARFIWQILAGQLDVDVVQRDFDRSVLLWRILGELDTALHDSIFSEIQKYLEDDHDGRKIFYLASKIADLFDQYLVYRPDLILSWESGTENGWQSALWKKLVRSSKKHRASFVEQFLTKARQGNFEKSLLPKQVYIFGISSLAPTYLDVIHAISSDVNVYLFHMSPCQEYWADVVSDIELARKRKKTAHKNSGEEEEYFFAGNSLLASLGKVGREFINQIVDYNMTQIEEEYYERPEGTSILESLQRDILELTDRAAPGTEKLVTIEGDRSVQLHSCHSRMREVQVLHNKLLELFESEPGLKPGDIIVMAPAIEEYTAAIRCVFDGVDREMFIPWSLADRSIRGEEPLVDSFLSLFDLCQGRFSAPDVISFLETEAVLKRFQIDDEGLATLRKWIDETRIRWGFDSEHRREFNCDMGEAYSWSFGLQRLLMGYCTGKENKLIQNIAPAGISIGSQGDLLGTFATFLERLRSIGDKLRTGMDPSEWMDFLLALLDDLFDPGNNEKDQQALVKLRETICALGEDTKAAGFQKPLNASVVKAYLKDALNMPSSGQAFLSGRVTFCNMVPMRSVPFAVVCLLGMNDSDYPRNQTSVGFDLIAKHPRTGDRNRRDDDRYLFLEALLSARRVLYISWCGRNQLDNSIRPPSVVVAELLDYISRSFVSNSVHPVEQFVKEHPLQPFSRKCYDGSPGTASYARQWLPVVDEEEMPVFISRPLSEPPQEYRTIDLKQFVQFWSHPVRFFLQNRLGMQMYENDFMLEESEVFQPDYLERYSLADRLIHSQLDGEPKTPFSLLRAEGKLPHGNFGHNFYDDLVEDIETFMPGINPLLKGGIDPLEVDIAIDDFHIRGWLSGLFDYGCVRFRPANLKGKDLVKLWIEHLVYNVSSGSERCRSIHIAKDLKAEFKPVDDPLTEMKKLLEMYWNGMNFPLQFFPETGWAWFNKGNEKGRENKASNAWQGGFNRRGECEDIEYRITMQGREALDQKFEQLAAAVYGPLFEHLELDDA